MSWCNQEGRLMLIVGKPESVRDVHVDWRLDHLTVVSFPKSVFRCEVNNLIQRIGIGNVTVLSVKGK